MAERKSGPVKPPTIELTARSADKPVPRTAKRNRPSAAETKKARPDALAASDTAPATGPDKARLHAESGDAGIPKAGPAIAGRLRMPKLPSLPPHALATGIVAAILGGALGLLAAYGLAVAGFWPQGGDNGEIASLSEEVHAIYAKKSEIGGIVDRALKEETSRISGLETHLSTLESAIPDDPGPALTALAERVGTLEAGVSGLGRKFDVAAIGGGDPAAEEALSGFSARLDAIAISLDDLESRQVAKPESIAALRISLSALADKVETLGQRLDELQTVSTQVATLESGLETLQSAPAPEPVDIRLPLALSGLAEALDTGAPFASELALIRAALPDLAVPDALAAAALSGLGSPADLQAEFAALLPDMLAAKPLAEDAGWTDRVLAYLKTLVALRPVDTTADAGPEALVGRIEMALANRDYQAASTAFAALPEPMRVVAGGLDEKIGQFAVATDLMTRARAAALTLAGTPS